MRKFLIVFAVAMVMLVVETAILYAACTFIANEGDPNHWGDPLRGTFAVLWMLLLFYNISKISKYE